MPRLDRYGLATRTIHGQQQRDPFGSPHMPIYDTTTFAFDDTASLREVGEGKKRGGFYSRYGMNPTLYALEDVLAGLEGAEAALSFSAGMGAISALLLAHGKKGVVGYGEIYGGTLGLMAKGLPSLGYPVDLVLGDEGDALERRLRAGAGLVFMETPSNPTLAITDIEKLARQAHAHGALVVVDNTFATPVNQLPLQLGADLVAHSATKYLGGHSDLSAGTVMGSRALLEPIDWWRRSLGSAPSPQTGSLLSRSLKTLSVRVAQHNRSAQTIAETLESHSAVRRVHYPGLANHPGHEVARRQMRGFGGMLTLELEADLSLTEKVAESLRWFALAPSLGGAESLVTQPRTTTHADLSDEERQRRGISDSMLRLSVGLEDVEDLIEDLDQALRLS